MTSERDAAAAVSAFFYTLRDFGNGVSNHRPDPIANLGIAIGAANRESHLVVGDRRFCRSIRRIWSRRKLGLGARALIEPPGLFSQAEAAARAGASMV